MEMEKLRKHYAQRQEEEAGEQQEEPGEGAERLDRDVTIIIRITITMTMTTTRDRVLVVGGELLEEGEGGLIRGEREVEEEERMRVGRGGLVMVRLPRPLDTY